MKNKKAIIGLGAIATLLFGVASSIAYLTDTDTTVNVMTVGNVKISQLEYERVVDENGDWISADEKYNATFGTDTYKPDALQPYTQNKPIVPAVYKDGREKWDDRNGNENASGNGSHQQSWNEIGAPGSNQLFDDSVKNVIDKFIFVKNTGRKAAYYRTIVAIELPEGVDRDRIHKNNTTNSRFVRSEIGYINIEGVRYLVFEYLYTDKLVAGEISRPSFLQIFLDPKTTSEEVELFGPTFEILAVSQAVQTDGFASAKEALDEAFGATTTTNHPWIKGVVRESSTTWTGQADTSWYNTTDNEFTLTTAEQLAGLSKLVNEGNSFAGKTINLATNVDLDNQKWTPIGNSNNIFKGIFDGGSHTISNLNVGELGQSNIGLFGMTSDGEVKNLTIKNATVYGRLNVGVVAGTPYTSKYTNITVSGKVRVEGMAYVGAVGGKNAYANWDTVKVSVDPGSYVKANSIENGTAYRTYVGGVIGFMGEGNHTMSNITSNIDVYGTTIDVGGITGIAHYGNTFKNCTSTGNVYITNATEAAEAEEIGGIAGVWHNQAGHKVTFDNCKFTGTLSTNFTEGVDLSDNTITGKSYSATGTGELIIK